MRDPISWRAYGRPHLAFALLIGLGIASCHEGPTNPPSPGGPAYTISDGAHQGNPHVFFLPPMLPDPSSRFTSRFEGSLDVAIHICVWDRTEESCGPALAMYNSNAGPGSETVRVPAGAEYYLVNWHTDDMLNQFPLGAGEVYRIQVLVRGTVVAFADVEVVGTARELKNVNTDEFIPLLDGRTLPIKVRIEAGWDGFADIQLVSAGGLYSCGIAGSGKAYCWGSNWAGQLGTGDYTSSNTPVEVAGGHTFVSVGTGSEYACGLRPDGAVYCWGFTRWNGTVYYGPTPVAVPGGLSFRTLSVGSYHACGIATDDRAYCWGNNGYRELGTGSTASAEAVPRPVLGGHTFKSIGPHGFHSCALTAEGAAYCWGYNGYGQVGNGIFTYIEPTPVPVVGGRAFTDLKTGGYHNCAVAGDGQGFCWGYNGYSQLGTGLGDYSRNVPTPVAGAIAFASIRPGGYHTCAIGASGLAYCWGYNGYGQLGNGTASYVQPIPVAVTGGRIFVDLSAGFMHTCGLTDGDDALCWGWNGYGQLGSGSFVTVASPVGVVEPPGGW